MTTGRNDIEIELSGIARPGGARPARRPEPVHIRLQGAQTQRSAGLASRLRLAEAICLAAFLVLTVRLFDVAVGRDSDQTVRTALAGTGADNGVTRADLIARDGSLLATDLATRSLYVDARLVRDPDSLAQRLRDHLPGLDAEKLVGKLNDKSGHFPVKRHLKPEQVLAVHRLGEPSLYFVPDHRRLYPHGRLFAHAVGFTDIDNRALAGAERYFDTQLRRNRDRPVRLTLDIGMQHALHEELADAMARYQCLGAAGLVLDARTGAIRAMVSLPDLDPNRRPDPNKTRTGNPYFNRVSLGTYEMGSTFKAFTTAIALDSGVADLRAVYDATKPLRIGGYIIRDFHAENRPLSVPEILMHSSNIGAAKMALHVGAERHKAYLADLGLLSPPSLELPEIASPRLPENWGEVYLATIAFGHGVAVTPVQTAAAFGALVNGGVWMAPTLDQTRAGDQDRARRVIRPETSRTMRQLLRLVVEKGTGRQAEADGFLVVGKTGTAEKPADRRRGYDRKRLITSFAAAFPADAPRYVVLVLLDEPKGTAETRNWATAGWNAAPTTGRIIARLGPLAGIGPRRVIDGGAAAKGGEYVSIDGDEIRLASY